MGQKLAQCNHAAPQHHFGLQIIRMDLVHKLAAATAGRYNIADFTDGHNFLNAVFARRNHGGNGRVLGAKSHGAGRVNAHAFVHIVMHSIPLFLSS